ncbi:MAG: biosynthetic arginine decarboxylase [Verrucomicrobiae bacterium]|nr:biosynthetic arginine decarboxylase [Verrucomicrobiae bacterium]
MTAKNGVAWSVQDALALYNIENWGGDYVSVNEKGKITVAPLQSKGPALEVMEVVDDVLRRGMGLPVLIRFQDLLRHRVESVNEAFRAAIEENEFKGKYFGVFPIKVNQLREVVEEVTDAGKPYHYGLEVGSKPELFSALAIHQDPESLIICNGYKDHDYVRAALLGRRLGKKAILVVEKLEEMRLVVQVAREAGIEPMVGVRLRLLSKGGGKWAESGGEDAKFGLSTTDLLDALEILRNEKMESCLKLLHFHVGSQIPDIAVIKRAVREAARYYAKLHQLGWAIEYFDVGGGLGVDYDGSRSSSDSSTNYSLQEYTSDVVFNVMEICDDEKVPHPHLVSESGRAVVAHHSVLAINIFGAIQKDGASAPISAEKGDHRIVRQLLEVRDGLNKRNRRESLHDAQALKEEGQAIFDLGLMPLKSKAKAERLFWQIATQVVELFKGARIIPEEIRKLEHQVSDQYLGNFSVFQSLLDHWAFGQIFPIVPLHRLDEPPTRNAILVDITCDSEGKISKFIGLENLRETLPLHSANGAPYYVGIFMVGAYQDIMGDLHNLFGRVNEVHVFLDPDEERGWYVEEVIEGSTISQVLAMTQYDANELARKMKAQVDQAIKEDRLKPSEGMRLLDDYENGLKRQTYLSFVQPPQPAPAPQLPPEEENPKPEARGPKDSDNGTPKK